MYGHEQPFSELARRLAELSRGEIDFLIVDVPPPEAAIGTCPDCRASPCVCRTRLRLRGTARIPECYVQFALRGTRRKRTLYSEAVSSAFLPASRQLTAEDESELRALGW